MLIVNIGDNLLTFLNRAKENKPFLTGIFIKGSIRRASHKAKANMFGKVGHIIRETLFKD